MGAKSRKRLDWSRPLPRPIVIPDLMTLRSLTDVRVLLSHLPKEYRAKETWRHHVAKTLDEAAGGGIQPVEVAVALKLALSMEGITSRPK
jgi:hypothetical protein